MSVARPGRHSWILAASLAGGFGPLGLLPAGPVSAQVTAESVAAAEQNREEQLARSIGTMAYLYAYPAVDYSRVMYENTTEGVDPNGVFAQVNRFYSVGELTGVGGPYAGRSPNRDTLYFQAWYDVSRGPVVIETPDTDGRYYNLDYVNFLAETEAHTGRRTTGTAAQTILLVGPRWEGTSPEGTKLVRMSTDRGIVVGRVLVTGEADQAVANELVANFRMHEAPGSPAAMPVAPVARDSLSDLRFFEIANAFLRRAAPVDGEQALMDQFDRIGIGPASEFDAASLSPARRRGLLRAIAEGKRLVEEARLMEFRGWSSVNAKIGVYGTDYLQRAAIEYSGLLANAPQEAVYPRYNRDPDGNLLSGTNTYRIVVPADLPVDAFWSLTPYSYETRDLMATGTGIFSVGSRDPKTLERQSDGSAVVIISPERPREKNVNWLPVSPVPFYLIMRLYQPQDAVFEDGFTLPEVERIH